MCQNVDYIIYTFSTSVIKFKKHFLTIKVLTETYTKRSVINQMMLNLQKKTVQDIQRWFKSLPWYG